MEQFTIKNKNKNTKKQRCGHFGGYSTVDIRNALRKAAVTHLKSHTTRAPCICSEAENSAILAKVKMLRAHLEMRR